MSPHVAAWSTRCAGWTGSVAVCGRGCSGCRTGSWCLQRRMVMSIRELGAADLLTREQIKQFTRTSNLGGAVAVIGTWAVIVAAFAAVVIWPTWYTFAGAVIVLGGRQLALAVIMHEAAHGTLFRSKWLNDATDWV